MKILHLENDPPRAEFVRASLKRNWPDCTIIPAASEPEYLGALQHGPYRFILSNLSMLGFDGDKILRASHQHAGDTPFIFQPPARSHEAAASACVRAIARALTLQQSPGEEQKADLQRAHLAAAVEHMPDCVGLFTPDGRLTYLNIAGYHLLGLSAGSLATDLSITSFHPPEASRRLVQEAIPAAARDGHWSGENVVLARTGESIPAAQVIVAHRGPDGEVLHFSSVLRDLRAQQRSDALMDGQRQVLEMIADGQPVGETLVTLLRFVEHHCPELFCAILLVSEDDQHLRVCAAPRMPADLVQQLDGLPIQSGAGSCGAAAHRLTSVIVEDITTDPLWIHHRDVALAHGFHASWSTPIFDREQQLLGTFAVYFKRPGPPAAHHRGLLGPALHLASICLSRNAVEGQLRSQANILNKATDAIFVADRSDRITFWNHGAERTFGWSCAEAVGRLTRELFPPQHLAAGEHLAEPPAEFQEWRGELQLKDRTGTVHIMDTRITPMLDDAGQPQGRLSIATDVTAKRRMEEQFFRAQRLESIGMLAAGIAHDLNNVLAPILLAAPMLRDHVSDPGDLRIIATLEKSAERGAALVRQILGFAQGADGELRVVQPKHLLRDVATFIRETFPKSIQLEEDVPSQLWPVKANPTQLHQVLLNLCVNARDAMQEGGTLTLRGENAVLDEIAASEIPDATPGPFLVFHVQDTGMGIPTEILNRIWDPFFTTKATGKGTGLGLSTVRGIVESHGGFSTVVSVPDRGTTFRIYLPAEETAGIQSGATSAAPFAPRGTGELVLIADDEPSIRNTAAVMLARHGYRVLTAADGAEAIALFAPRCKEIPLVITDLSMPKLDGAALAGVVQRLNPAVKIIAVSGHHPASGGDARAPSFTDAFLVKPFRAEALLTTVHELLRAPPNLPPLSLAAHASPADPRPFGKSEPAASWSRIPLLRGDSRVS